MPRFKCTNEQCNMLDKEVCISKVRYKYNPITEKTEIVDPIFCLACGKELEQTLNLGGPATIMINRFSAKSPEEKRECIKKRSQDHFKKTDRGDLDNYKKQVVSDIRAKNEGRV